MLKKSANSKTSHSFLMLIEVTKILTLMLLYCNFKFSEWRELPARGRRVRRCWPGLAAVGRRGGP